MGDKTLLVRHLPSSFTKEEKEDFLQHFGAVDVRVMGSKGPLKHAAFAEFPSRDAASQVLGKLHQAEVLGCHLVVQFAHAEHSHHLPDSSHREKKIGKEECEEEKKDEKEETENEDSDFDFSFLQWGLKYPRRRHLHYLYPPPTQSILANISHALAACPRLYVQVLHLMNKMDLPAPFGPVTPQPPLVHDMQGMVNYADSQQFQEMMSSTEESEVESDPETSRPKQEMPRKRKQADSSRKQMKKHARLAVAMFQLTPALQESDTTRHTAPPKPLTEVFEQAAEAGGQKKIHLKLPGARAEPAAVAKESEKDVREKEPLLPPPLPPLFSAPPLPPPSQPSVASSSEVTQATAAGVPQSTGFGVMAPVHKAKEDTSDEDEKEAWSEIKFISKSELHKGRLSIHEMKESTIFRNYTEGDSSRRLYIKNLSRQVTEEDLHWVFGRYINWDDELQKNMFDIRLMKEGRMKGQAFITLGSEGEAAKAVRDTNAFILKGKPMVVHFARSAKQQEESKS